MRVRELGVWLRGRHVATFTAPRTGRLTCHYTAEVLDEHPLNVPVLSCSLPLRTGRQDAWAFAGGLLPEGRHRQAMADLARVTTTDVLGMLHRFGRDVAGAVIVAAEDPPVREAAVEPYTPAGLDAAVASLDEHPLGLYDDSELSVAGLQDKMLLVALPDGRWARPVHGYPSSHILKVDDRRRPGLVHAEHTCLRLAQTAGLDAPDSHLIRVGDADCLVVRRFDRTTVAGEVTRVHQEDACQALGVDPEGQGRRAKYESFGGPSLRAVAQLLGAWAADSDTELLRLLDHLVFTVLIGNADAHGKNVALLHPRPGEIRLAPLYDTVPTVLWPQLRQDAAMSVAGRFRLPAITVDDVVREAAGWPLPAGAARERTVAVAETLRDSCGRLDASLDVRALEAIARRADDFLATAAV